MSEQQLPILNRTKIQFLSEALLVPSLLNDLDERIIEFGLLLLTLFIFPLQGKIKGDHNEGGAFIVLQQEGGGMLCFSRMGEIHCASTGERLSDPLCFSRMGSLHGVSQDSLWMSWVFWTISDIADM